MRTRALPLVTIMWLMTGVSLAAAVLRSAGSPQPSANPGHVVVLLMGWMTIFVIAALIRFTIAPNEIEGARRTGGPEAAMRRSDSLQESMWYLLGIAPLVALMAYDLTGWATGSAALWVGGLLGMLLLAPDPRTLERLATGAR